MMSKYLFTCLLCSWLVASAAFADAKVKIACVGNSITYGAIIPNREKNSYPAQLQAYLGDGYIVENFGSNGATLLSKGNYPYVETDAYKRSLAFNPDVVLIKLGTNDSKPQNLKFVSEFKGDYAKLIDSYRNLPSKPRIVLLTPVRCFDAPSVHSSSAILNEIVPLVKDVAYEQNLEIINLQHLFGNQHEGSLFPDRLHPSSIGAGKIARKLYSYLAVKPEPSLNVRQRIPFKVEREFNFHGFKGYVYKNGDVEYYLVEPRRPAVGNPWMVRARFWNHEPQTDIAMLENGFYLTYCDVADLYGAPVAVKRWDDFYRVMTKAGLAKKVVLEGMSRGGLIVYNWAARNVGKVACIYADAPVMDFKSWPMGKGKSEGSGEDTQRLMKVYGFASEADALKWEGNPVDHAKKLAKAHVPMLHVVGDADVVVPYDENTAVFEKRVKEHGGAVTVIHKPGVGHHPHSLFNPEPIVRFILEATGRAENMCAHPVCGNEYRSGAGWREGAEWHTVSEEISSVLKGRNLDLLLVGNSITQGFGGSRSLVTYKPGKAALDSIIGKERWESAGISGDRTQQVLWRLQHGQYGLCSPKNVVITIGINNVVGDDDSSKDVADGIAAIAKEAVKQFPSSHIIVFGLLPSDRDKGSDVRNRCDGVHLCLAKMGLKGVTYVDPTSWFVNPDGSLKTELYSGDFLHLNGAGYLVWAKKIAELIR